MRIFSVILSVIISAYALYACNGPENGGNAVLPLPDTISYNFDIRPVLSDKCFTCHGPDANKRQADLRLDIPASAYGALKDNPAAHGLVPGKPELSEVFYRISSQDTAEMMPPYGSNLKLSAYEISLIKKWISQGAKYETHWAFVAPRSPALPAVKKKEWPRNEIDYFVLDKMEQKNLGPNAEADKERLLKRVSLDITGLPPGLELMDRFLSDKSPGAYDKMVNELLQSSAYGEKMALHWMDVARYADSHGYQDDNYRTQWPWRDWVIHAFNQNFSYEKFITWQLAGDLMPEATKEQVLATGFNRNHKITEEGGVIQEEYRVAYVTDRINTFGKALMGITMECAHCHDHKYDPVSQKEYYQLYSFFNNVKEVGIESSVGGPETFAKKPLIEIKKEDIQNLMTYINQPDTNKLIVSVMGDQDTVRKTHILIRGVYDAPGEEVEPATPKAILAFNPEYPKNRFGLAEWLFDKKNPLTSRVFVNQLWEQFFGRGIVKTAGDFGMQGELPSHPELLDWLAVDFMNHGWDIKRLVKQMVTSAVYRQSAVVTPEKLKTDPANILLARSPRYRLEAETIRDVVLSSSGLLVKTIGGPSVKPYQPPGLWEGATSGRGLLSVYKQDHGASLYRRGLYTFVKRTVPPASMGIFDASNRDECQISRLKTNTPLQALVMLNDPAVLEASRALAATLLAENISGKEKINKAFRMIVCRFPSAKESETLNAYYESQAGKIKKEAAEKLINVGELPLPEKTDAVKLASLMRIISTMYNLEETITKS